MESDGIKTETRNTKSFLFKVAFFHLLFLMLTENPGFCLSGIHGNLV